MTCLICKKDFSGNANICPECIALMEKGARQGDAKIQCHLGRCYLEGDGVPQNYEQAFKWFQKSAEQNNPAAQQLLGMSYYNGYGISRDREKAFYWFEKAIKQNENDFVSQSMIGQCYREGYGVPKNNEKAIYWLKKSAESGYAPAQYELCLCYFFDSPKEYREEAVFWCQKAAEQGIIQAQCLLGNCYYSGISVPLDMEKAIYWLEKSKDYDLSQLLLGFCYFHGKGVPKDKEKAFSWYKKSAEQGNSYAQFFLAGCYSFGDGTQKDEKKSEYWYTKAAASEKQNQDLNFILASITETWQERFMKRIWNSKKKEVEIYKKADISKQHFSKIRSDRNYSPKKETVLALTVGLELELAEAVKFLAEAGYAFSDINPTDMIVRDFISKKQYDIRKINDFLFQKNLPLIGNTRNSEKRI